MGLSGWCGSVFPEIGETRALLVGTTREGVTMKEVTDDREPMNTSKAVATKGIDKSDLRIVILALDLDLDRSGCWICWAIIHGNKTADFPCYFIFYF